MAIFTAIGPNDRFFVENLSESTPENRASYNQWFDWSSIRPDLGPIQGGDSNRRYWLNVGLTDPGEPDLRYERTIVYDYVEYDPNPNDAIPAGDVLPWGERKARAVDTLKDDTTLLALVATQQTQANNLLFPQDGIAFSMMEAARIRALAIRSAAEDAFLVEWHKYEAAVSANAANAAVLARAVKNQEDFDLMAGWTTSVE